jgi:hypothetical protein
MLHGHDKEGGQEKHNKSRVLEKEQHEITTIAQTKMKTPRRAKGARAKGTKWKRCASKEKREETKSD